MWGTPLRGRLMRRVVTASHGTPGSSVRRENPGRRLRPGSSFPQAASAESDFLVVLRSIIVVEVPLRRVGIVVDLLAAPGSLGEFHPGHPADQVERVDEICE